MANKLQIPECRSVGWYALVNKRHSLTLQKKICIIVKCYNKAWPIFFFLHCLFCYRGHLQLPLRTAPWSFKVDIFFFKHMKRFYTECIKSKSTAIKRSLRPNLFNYWICVSDFIGRPNIWVVHQTVNLIWLKVYFCKQRTGHGLLPSLGRCFPKHH